MVQFAFMPDYTHRSEAAQMGGSEEHQRAFAGHVRSPPPGRFNQLRDGGGHLCHLKPGDTVTPFKIRPDFYLCHDVLPQPLCHVVVPAEPAGHYS